MVRRVELSDAEFTAMTMLLELGVSLLSKRLEEAVTRDQASELSEETEVSDDG